MVAPNLRRSHLTGMTRDGKKAHVLASFYPCDRRILTSSDLDFLQRIFDEEIRIRGLTCDCDDAEALAASLVELFQADIRDASHLRQMLKAA